MSPETEPHLWDTLLAQFPVVKYLVLGLVASCGAMTRYFWDSIRGVSTLTFVGFITYIFLGFFVGNLVGSFMPLDYEYRDGLLLLSGFTVKELLEIVQNRGAGTIANFLKLGKGESQANKKEK